MSGYIADVGLGYTAPFMHKSCATRFIFDMSVFAAFRDEDKLIIIMFIWLSTLRPIQIKIELRSHNSAESGCDEGIGRSSC